MQRFLIPFLITLEENPKPESLEFLTQTWIKEHTFNHLNDNPAVSCIDGKFYLEDGNKRAVWFWLNGIEYIDAEFISFDSKNFTLAKKSNKEILKENLKKGIYSPIDLAKRIENPELYCVKPQITLPNF